MPDQTIICPNCGKKIPLTETLTHQIKDNLRKEFEVRAKEIEISFAKREKLLIEEAEKLEKTKQTLEKEVSERLKSETEKIKREAKKEALAALELEFRDLKEQNEEKDKKLEEARKAELEFRKRMRELEEQKKSVELEVARKIDKEREKIKQTTLEMFTEEHRLKELEKDKKISDMLKTIEDLKRKAQQGSMQTQGEVLELDIEGLLKTTFPTDEIEPVPKGMRGADILQKVFNSGQYCGTIIWEAKHTKTWSDTWVSKLKDDQRAAKAEIAILATETMPKGVNSFTHIDGVWVADFSLVGNLADVLRKGIIDLFQLKRSSVGKNEKMEFLYDYLSGPEFKQKVEAIVEAFKVMKEDLDHERRSMTKMWAKREKQIERVILNTGSMYGDMQGIIGASLPQIKLLEMGEDEEEELSNEEEIT